MKVESLQDLSRIVQEENRQASRTGPAGASFQQLLNEAAAVGVQSQSVVQGPTASGWNVSSAVGASMPNETEGMHPMMGALDGALGQLATLCTQAGQAPLDLRAVAQALTNLGQTADEIVRRTQALAENHPVRRLAEEARVLAYVESVKWRRGDYL
ncbi:hypothetical protein [Desulfosoma sp.]